MPRLIFVLAALFAVALAVSPVRADFFKTLKSTLDASGVVPGTATTAGALSLDDIAGGLREALKVGAERVVAQIGAADGFNADQAIHIPLPPALQKVQSTLSRFGLSALADEVETKLNRGAEAAMPRAKALIWKAIAAITLDDARRIYDGPDDAATQYFRTVAGGDLLTDVRPIIEQTLADAGALAAYDQLMGQYAALPFVPNVKANLTDHAAQLAVDGLFHYLAAEEKQIRQDPAKRTTDLLARVFGQ